MKWKVKAWEAKALLLGFYSLPGYCTESYYLCLMDWGQMGLCSVFCLSEDVLGVVTRALPLHPVSICSHWYNSYTEV